MIVYVLPGVGRFGGVKVGFRFAELLRSLDVPIVVATPGGAAPRWFRCSVPVVAREAVLPRLGSDDVAMFSLPHDHEDLTRTDARLVLHCQGTDPLIDPVVADERVVTLTCWEQAREYVAARSAREPIEVGISISDVFSPDRSVRRPGSIAYMPRRGWIDPIEQYGRRRGVELIRIEGDDEATVARKMASASIFAAVAEGEWFGLPALEAMASGCAVVSVPVLGGLEYLHDGENSLVRPIEEFAATFDGLLDDRCDDRVRTMARNGSSTALRYRRSTQRVRLAELLDGPLGDVLR